MLEDTQQTQQAQNTQQQSSQQQTQQQNSADNTQQQSQQQQQTQQQDTSQKKTGGDQSQQQQQQQTKVVPEKYDLKLSETTLLVPRDTERIAAFAKEQKLSQEEAQALVEKTEADYQAYRDDLVTAWNTEVQNDKELGGANFAATTKHLKAAMDFLAPEGSPLRALLFNSGYGSNPEVVRAFAKLGKHLGEDRPPAGAKPGEGAPAPKEQPLENRMFPNQVPTPVG